MKNKLIIIFTFLFMINLSLTSGAIYVVGEVSDAEDGTSANGHTVMIWNPKYGTVDNVTDIIGKEGNSQTENIYLIDCEDLKNICQVGDVIQVRVLNNGDGYISITEKVNINNFMNIASTLKLIKKRTTFLCSFFRC